MGESNPPPASSTISTITKSQSSIIQDCTIILIRSAGVFNDDMSLATGDRDEDAMEEYEMHF